MCGKNGYLIGTQWKSLGSPPHVREKPTEMAFFRESMRDHPRMCGKNEKVKGLPKRRQGSPPHVREKRIVSFHKGIYYRITPACAGKTEPT